MSSKGLTRRTAGIYIFCILVFFASATIIRILMGYSRPIHEILGWVALCFTGFAALFALYVRGWEASGWIATFLYAIFTAVFMPERSLADFMPIALIMPVIVASILTDWMGIVATGTLIFAIIAARRGYVGLLRQTVPVLNYVACVLGILTAWLVQDRARHEAHENADKFERLNVELDGAVRTRTAELESTNGALSHANEELTRTIVALNEAQDLLIVSEKKSAIGRLAANTAHELNTPLGAIASSAESMARALEDNLARLVEKGSAQGPEAINLAVEVLRAAARTEPLHDHGTQREFRAAIERALAEQGFAHEGNLAADLAIYGDASLAVRLAPYLGRAGGREFIEALGALAFALISGRMIRMAVDQASRAIQALQYYARDPSPRNAVILDIGGEIRSLIELYRNKLAGRVEIELRLFEDSAALAIPDELKLILANLIDNALEAMEYRGKLSLATEVDGAFLRVAISDSGPGIPENLSGRVFEPFFTTKRQGEGIGLGLDLVRKMTETIGGKVSFVSTAGGTIFTLSLPRPAPGA